jgi:hypothetical protein
MHFFYESFSQKNQILLDLKGDFMFPTWAMIEINILLARRCWKLLTNYPTKAPASDEDRIIIMTDVLIRLCYPSNTQLFEAMLKVVLPIEYSIILGHVNKRIHTSFILCVWLM